MADTRQCISWSLAHPCKLRHGPDWHLPVEASRQLSQVQYCAEELSKPNPRAFDGILVTCHTWGRDAKGQRVDIPSGGIPIHKLAEPFDGWSNLRKTCDQCPANTFPKNKSQNPLKVLSANSKGQRPVAGCFGDLDSLALFEHEYRELLWQTVDQAGLREPLESAFQITTPIWYGFWIDSPLSIEQCRVLSQLFYRAVELLRDESSELMNHPSLDKRFYFSDFDPVASKSAEYEHFIRALQSSIENQIPLHVHLSPPGHTDCGFYTQFAHCPRCKCAADVPRWQEVDSQDYICHACNHTF